MTLQGRTALNLIAGAIAGLLTWLLTDTTGWFVDVLSSQRAVGLGLPGYGKYLLYGALFGLILGLMLALVDARSLDSERQMGRTITWGGLIGFVGGALGLALGQTAYGLFVPAGSGNDMGRSPLAFGINLFGRAIGWGLIGGIVGLAQGVSRRSTIIMRQGVFGGLIGGLIGGTTFDIIADIFGAIPHIDVLSRLAALVATGAMTGLFIGLVQTLFKQAWIRLVLGKNEGKEYLIAKPIMSIGRSELSDIGLFGDPAIAPTHTVIESHPAQKRYRLRHVAGAPKAGAPAYAVTIVNGQPVTAEQWLADGDTIQIGRRTLQFREKAVRGRPPVPRPSVTRPTLGTDPNGLPPAAQNQSVSGIGSPEDANRSRVSLTPSADVLAQMGTDPSAAPSSAVSVSPAPSFSSDTGGIGTRLVCESGPYTGQSFGLTHQALTVGRATDNPIALPGDTSVSRVHARITYSSGRHWIEDAGSSNGTLVNNQRVLIAQPLTPGDRIRLGETTLRYD